MTFHPPASEASQPHSTGINDLDLVGRWLDGCSTAFEALVVHYRPRLQRALVARCNGSVVDAEDLVQETFTRVFQQREKFDPQYRFSTWIYTIAFRLAMDHQRRQRRIFWIPFETHHDPIAPPSGSELAESIDEVENIWLEARRLLNSDQYLAMWLKYGEDLSVVEISRVMQKTQICVRTLLHRARARLVETLAPQTLKNRPGK